ncbi:hypothetical protein Tco_0424888 [Tanacetum coccineum]
MTRAVCFFENHDVRQHPINVQTPLVGRKKNGEMGRGPSWLEVTYEPFDGELGRERRAKRIGMEEDNCIYLAMKYVDVKGREPVGTNKASGKVRGRVNHRLMSGENGSLEEDERETGVYDSLRARGSRVNQRKKSGGPNEGVEVGEAEQAKRIGRVEERETVREYIRGNVKMPDGAGEDL